MTIFKPKPWVNPFGKMSIFRLLELLVFIAQKGVFLILKYRKRHFPGLYGLRKKHLEKWRFLDQIQGLNPFGKMSILRLFELFVFYSLETRFFVAEYRKRHFPALYYEKIKLEKWPFLHQNHWKNVNFTTFELLVFIAQKDDFSFQNIVKHIFLA